jgi:hypothetical protein
VQWSTIGVHRRRAVRCSDDFETRHVPSCRWLPPAVEREGKDEPRSESREAGDCSTSSRSSLQPTKLSTAHALGCPGVVSVSPHRAFAATSATTQSYRRTTRRRCRGSSGSDGWRRNWRLANSKSEDHGKRQERPQRTATRRSTTAIKLRRGKGIHVWFNYIHSREEWPFSACVLAAAQAKLVQLEP